MLTIAEMAQMCGVATKTISQWQRKGLIHAHRFNDRNQFLYEDPGPNPPMNGTRRASRQGRPGPEVRK
jgi:predicted site-specific integrase-resolvase